MTPTAAEAAFHRAMLAIYERAKREAGYNATRFHQMVAEIGGVETARRLLTGTTVPEGLFTLAQAGRLDLSVEAHVLDPSFRELFTADEQAIARRRLRDLGWTG